MLSRYLAASALALAVTALAAAGMSPRRTAAGVPCEATPITEWKESEGGNGHFYRGACPIGSLDWDDARDGADALGGHLVTITSSAENDFVYGLIESRGFWDQDGDWCPGPLIGLLQADGAQEPEGGWDWLTGEPFGYENWGSGEPDNFGPGGESRAAYANASCDAGNVSSNEWYDIGEQDEHPSYVIEWDTAPPACKNTPVMHWPVGEGGNGHYYYGVCGDDRISWPNAQSNAAIFGGHLATTTSAEENDFVFDLIDSPEFWSLTSYNCIVGPWIGGYQPAGSDEPDGNWQWITAEPFSYTNWSEGEPDNFDDDNRMAFWDGCPGPGRTSEWVDLADGVLGEVTSYVIEWEERPDIMGDVDCDGDVDEVDVRLLLSGLASGGLGPCVAATGTGVAGTNSRDVDCSTGLTALDPLHILLYLVGLPELPKSEDCPLVGHPVAP
jgi:hypothetical protein